MYGAGSHAGCPTTAGNQPAVGMSIDIHGAVW